MITPKIDSHKNAQTIHQPEKPKDSSPRSKQMQTMIASNDTQKNSLSNDSNQHAKLNNSQHVSSSKFHLVSPPQKTTTSNNNQARKQVTAPQPNSARSHQTKQSNLTKTINNQHVSSTNNRQLKHNSVVVKQTNNSLNRQANVNRTQVKKPTTASSTANQNASASNSQKMLLRIVKKRKVISLQ